MKINTYISLMLVSIFLYSCTPTEVVQSSAKQTENAKDISIENISLVTFCMSPSRSEGFERALVGAFSAEGIGVMGTMDRFYGGPIMSREEWNLYLQALKTDAILVTRIIPYKAKNKTFGLAEYANPPAQMNVKVPGSKSEADMLYDSMFPSYAASHQILSLQDIKTVRLQCTLYSLDDLSVLWTSTSTFIKPKQLEKVRELYAAEVAARFKNDMN